jgi:hypothetical protein
MIMLRIARIGFHSWYRQKFSSFPPYPIQWGACIQPYTHWVLGRICPWEWNGQHVKLTIFFHLSPTYSLHGAMAQHWTHLHGRVHNELSTGTTRTLPLSTREIVRVQLEVFTAVNIPVVIFPGHTHWRWQQYICHKKWHLPAQLYCIITQ